MTVGIAVLAHKACEMRYSPRDTLDTSTYTEQCQLHELTATVHVHYSIPFSIPFSIPLFHSIFQSSD